MTKACYALTNFLLLLRVMQREIRKHKTQVATDKEAVDISKWGVSHAEKKVKKKAEAVTRREDMVIGQRTELVKERDKIEFQKQVTLPCPL